jgi:glycosyltransferase involved in cell wall biosynthesis
MTMRLAIVNPVWDSGITSPDATLDRFRTLTGWADALVDAGATVTVFQRFPTAAAAWRAGVHYAFVPDDGPAVPSRRWSGWPELTPALAAVKPDIVHINGVVFPEWLRACRRRWPLHMKMIAQDHGGWHPQRASALARWWVRRGLSLTDGVLVSSPGHAAAWRAARVVPGKVPLRDVMESSTDVVAIDRGAARRQVGMRGDPAVLWVGRLTPDKDPMTVLDGFARSLKDRPGATLTWVFPEGPLELWLRRAIEANPALASRTDVVGPVPHDQMAAYYSAADIYVSGSRLEGSGYAAIEAMACGAAPVLTDIPSFRALTGQGRVGALWSPGSAEGLTEALARVAADTSPQSRARVRQRFEDTLAWNVLGRRALAIYREICAR